MTKEAFKDFCPTLAEMLATPASFPALSTANNLKTIRALMSETGAKRTLEIGLSYGGSALAFCASHRELGHQPASQHVAIDPFQASIWQDAGISAIRRAGLEKYVDVRVTHSALALPRLLQDGRRFDLIYIDGSHLFEDVFVDAYFAARLLDPGGIVLFDDSTDPHIAKVLRFLQRNAPGLTRIDLSKFRQDNLKYRIAQYLGKTQLTGFKKTGDIVRKWDSPFAAF
jgi:predicted O-methyltransferase YrrM